MAGWIKSPPRVLEGESIGVHTDVEHCPLTHSIMTGSAISVRKRGVDTTHAEAPRFATERTQRGRIHHVWFNYLLRPLRLNQRLETTVTARCTQSALAVSQALCRKGGK